MNLFNIIAGSSYRPIEATGGTITEVSVGGQVYRVHTFLAVPAAGGSPAVNTYTFDVTDVGDEGLVEYLVVGGGGGGGRNSASLNEGGGGGGAGGYFSNVGQSKLSAAVQSYPITVGFGGLGGRSGQQATNGENTTALGFTATGGGKGGNAGANGSTGGSGGGGGGRLDGSTPAQFGTGAAGTSGQGNAGGDGVGSAGACAGGGGGAASAGLSGGILSGGGAVPDRNTVGIGGAGIANSITGTSVIYASGGHGGQSSFIASVPTGGFSAPVDNSGSGAHGQLGGVQGAVNAANGIVVIRYPLF